MKHTLTFIFGLILMVAPFVPTPSIADEAAPVRTIQIKLTTNTEPPVPITNATIKEVHPAGYTTSLTYDNDSSLYTFTCSGTVEQYGETKNCTQYLGSIILKAIGYNDVEINPYDIEEYSKNKIPIEKKMSYISYIDASNVKQCEDDNNGIAQGYKTSLDKKCFPCKCNEGYVLATKANRTKIIEIRDYQNYTNILDIRDIANTDICPESNIAQGLDQLRLLISLKTATLTSDLQCLKITGCSDAKGVSSSQYELDDNKYVCRVTCDTTQGYTANTDRTRCKKDDDCSDNFATDANVRYAEWRQRNGKYVCIITECVRGYEPNDAGTECVAKVVLPADKSAERINDLQGVYNEAKANETSDANKMLGGASMGVTGAGGMMLAMGLAEQKADNAAYEQMRGYVSTFKCNYGANNIEYSVEPTQLPTSTELTNLYAEYVTLANDLKMRKSALGLRAGLESQPILDSATSGLYDDVSSGRAAGTFTSLARAILDPNGEDAKKWAEQTQKSKNLIIAGGVTAGVGVVGGIVGNVLINKDAPNLQSVREKIDYINKQYEEFYKEIKRNAENLNAKVIMNPTDNNPEPTDNGKPKEYDNPTVNGYPLQDYAELHKEDNGGKATECPDGVTGTPPDCDCGDGKIYDLDSNQCLPKQGGIPLGNAGKDLNLMQKITYNPLPTPTNITLSIPGSTLFDKDKHDVKPEARRHIEDLVNALAKLAEETKIGFNNVIYVNGYTDPLGLWRINQPLSEKRARAVMGVIVAKVGELNNPYLTQTETNENTVGKGEADCTCAAGIDIEDEEQVAERRKDQKCRDTTKELSEIKFDSSKTNDTNIAFPPCRRVEISIILPEISAETLRQYGFTVGDSEISISDFIEKINQAAAVSTQ